MGERRHLVRSVQPEEGQPPPGGGLDAAHAPAEAATAGALHPPRRAEDPARLAPVSARPRRLDRLGPAGSTRPDRPVISDARAGGARPPREPGESLAAPRARARGCTVTDDVTPEPQYATSSPAGSSGTGSFHGAFSAPGMRPGTLSIGFGSPLKRSGKRASTMTSSSSRDASSSASIVSPERGLGSKEASSIFSSPPGRG